MNIYKRERQIIKKSYKVLYGRAHIKLKTLYIYSIYIYTIYILYIT